MSEEIPKYRLRSMFPLSTLNSHITCTPWCDRGSSLSRNALICRRTASSTSCIWCGCTSGPGTFCGLRQIPRHLVVLLHGRVPAERALLARRLEALDGDLQELVHGHHALALDVAFLAHIFRVRFPR